MFRAALYIRVSTDEQAQRGYSLDAQQEALEKYAKEHELFVVGRYADEGASARKPYKKRPEFMRMLADIQEGKIDLILFIKLDRWFRSVKDYYKIQEILEAHKVEWKAVMENYDTSTASGRLHVNIMLSVAQDEADRTSERIKFVFADKIQRHEVVTGIWPIGFRVENKHLVHDESKIEMVRDLFSHFEAHHSKFGARTYIIEKYGVYIEKKSVFQMLKNPLYKGEYRGIKDYCPPIIEPERFDRIQEYTDAKSIRKAPSNRVYLFSGLMKCGDCSYTMSGRYSHTGASDYYHYRCNKYTLRQCTHKRLIGEKDIEAYLLENVKDMLTAYVMTQRVEMAKKKPACVDLAKVRLKLTRLKELYLNELISIDEYRTDYAAYQKMLDETPPPPIDTHRLDTLEQLANSNFERLYAALDRESKRSMWHNMLHHITVSGDNDMKIFFA